MIAVTQWRCGLLTGSEKRAVQGLHPAQIALSALHMPSSYSMPKCGPKKFVKDMLQVNVLGVRRCLQ
jgi:hypothetical protein